MGHLNLPSSRRNIGQRQWNLLDLMCFSFFAGVTVFLLLVFTSLGDGLAASGRRSLAASDPMQRERILSILDSSSPSSALAEIEACSPEEVDEMPCEDPRRNSQLSRDMNFYRERHCPPPDEIPLCLVPPPQGYRIPVPWPESLHKIWHDNMPYNKLAERKGHQGWMKEEGPYFIFPGGGTMFPGGAMQYIEKLGQFIPISGGVLRTALDIGCGVASFGGFLLKENITTLSFAPRDSHKAQIQFALERGLPAFVAMIGTHRLPFPAYSFDLVHCSRCLIPFSAHNATYFIEVDRLLRPGGYLVISGPPVQWPKQDKEWADLQAVAHALCYEIIVVDSNTAIWRKPSGSACLPIQNEFGIDMCSDSDDPSEAWYYKLKKCVNKFSIDGEIAVGSIFKWPERLLMPSARVSLMRNGVDVFEADTRRWARRVAYYKKSLGLNSNSSPSPTQAPSQSVKTYELTACSISYTKPTAPFTLVFNKPCEPALPHTYILRDVSFTARPAEVLAIVGPSGAGKSTLLDILAARTAPTAGSLLLNYSPLHPSSFRKLSAYVPQHDSSLPLLTVSETFSFAAGLLLRDHSLVRAAVSSLLADLRLSHISNTRLSDGLSGGERRRVSIGLSLLHDPAVLLLDEPTSGLDSSSAFNVVQSLKTVAVSRRRTVLLSIHQPSFKLLSVIDSVLLLSKGSVVHHGSIDSLEGFLLSSGFTVPSQLNPLEYAMEILHSLPTTTSAVPDCASTPPQKLINKGEAEIRYTSSRVHEIITLYRRFWKIVHRSKQLLLTNALEALIVGLLLGTIYIHVGYDKQGMEKRLGFFAFTLTFLLSSTTETLPIFVTERPILLRETSSGVYRLSSHLIANTLVFLPYLLSISLLYSSSVYFIVGLCATWAAFANFVLIVWAVVLTANSFVLFVSSLAPNYIAGTSLLTISLAGFFLFSGYFMSKESMPACWLFMHYLSPYKYGLDALLANEYGCEAGRCFEGKEEGAACEVTGRDVLLRRGLKVGQRLANLEVLLGFFVFYRVLYWVVLTRRASRSKR